LAADNVVLSQYVPAPLTVTVTGIAFTVIEEVLPLLIELLQPVPIPENRLVIVTVVDPLFNSAGVVKLPIPAVVTVIVAVAPVTAFGAFKL
jgi:hypothetical protein